jgi:transposase
VGPIRGHPALRQARVELLTKALSEELEHWRMRPLVEALMTLRGVDQLVAMTLAAEIGELKRFAHPTELMSYLGLCRASTPAARNVAWERSPRRAIATHGGC